jgi:hypothetical protein
MRPSGSPKALERRRRRAIELLSQDLMRGGRSAGQS